MSVALAFGQARTWMKALEGCRAAKDSVAGTYAGDGHLRYAETFVQ